MVLHCFITKKHQIIYLILLYNNVIVYNEKEVDDGDYDENDDFYMDPYEIISKIIYIYMPSSSSFLRVSESSTISYFLNGGAAKKK